jgi:hypothetical protein
MLLWIAFTFAAVIAGYLAVRLPCLITGTKFHLTFMPYVPFDRGFLALSALIIFAATALYVKLHSRLKCSRSDSLVGGLFLNMLFLLLFAIPTGITYYLLWAIPREWGVDTKFIAAIIASIAYFTFFSLVMVPYSTLTIEMTDSYDERSKLAAYRMFVSIVGGLVAIAIPSVLVPDLLPDKSNLNGIHNGYLLSGVIIAVIVGFLCSEPQKCQKSMVTTLFWFAPAPGVVCPGCGFFAQPVEAVPRSSNVANSIAKIFLSFIL